MNDDTMNRGRATAARKSWRAALALTLGAALLLAGCGDKKDPAASQTAARVDRDEITVHQINFLLQQQRHLKPEHADAASRQLLERLIDQQLALQKAEELKLDRDPRVLQQLDATRREVIARAYYDKIGEGVQKPTPEEVKKYYEDKPALFKDRRIYQLQEIAIEARADQLPAIGQALGAAKTTADFIEYLKANDYRFAANQAVRPAEQLPLASLDILAKMKDGEARVVRTPTGATVIVRAGSRSQPIDEERARPAIEQFLQNDRKRKLVDEHLKSLRKTAKIEYVGRFGTPAPGGAASAPAGALPAASEAEAGAVSSAGTAIATPVAAASALPAAAPAATTAASASVLPATASGGLSDSDISKGMGLKK